MSEKKKKENVFIIESLSAIKDYLQHSPESIVRFICKPSGVKKAKDLSDKIPIHIVKEEKKIDLNRSHKKRRESVLSAEILFSALREDEFVRRLKREQEDKPPIIIVLDHLKDPVNIGGIIRNAAFFGVPFIIIPSRRQAPINETVITAAQGGTVYTKIVEVVNLARVLERLKKLNYWIVGGALEGRKVENIKGEYQKIALVIGSEDKGLSKLIKERCDVLVRISQSKQNAHNSLNASVASAVLLYALQVPL